MKKQQRLAQQLATPVAVTLPATAEKSAGIDCAVLVLETAKKSVSGVQQQKILEQDFLVGSVEEEKAV